MGLEFPLCPFFSKDVDGVGTFCPVKVWEQLLLDIIIVVVYLLIT